MAADFIEAQNGNIYLRLTGNTTQVYFNAVSNSDINYTLSIAGLQVNNTGTLKHIFNDDVDNTNQPAIIDGVLVGPNQNALLDGTGASFVNEVSGDPGGHAAATSFKETAKHYTVTWFNPFSNANYTPSVTVLENNYTASGYPYGMVLFAVADIQAGSFKVQFKTTTKTPEPQDLGYVRAFSVSATAPFSISKYGGVNNPTYVGINQTITAGGAGTNRYYLVTGVNQNGDQYTTTNQNRFLCLGNTVLQFQNNQNNLIAYPGTLKSTNLFVKSSGNWKPSRNIFVKHGDLWRICEKVWVKSGNVWKESYVHSSNWVNMLENFDDALDFAVQVVEVI